MVAITTVSCDNCASDLTGTKPHHNYGLELAEHRVPSASGLTLAVHVIPQLQRTHHFCDLGCLHMWLNRREEEKNGR